MEVEQPRYDAHVDWSEDNRRSYISRDWLKLTCAIVYLLFRMQGRFPFDQIFRFEIPGVLCDELPDFIGWESGT